jgi:hypothetical protein
MAGSLAGRSWRVRRLEGLARGREGPAPSRTEREARALGAEIREVEEQLQALGADPDEWGHAGGRRHLSPEEHIAAIEKELGDYYNH